MNFIKNCGIMLEPQEGMSVPELLELAESAERLGFGYLCRSDHLIDTGGRKGRESSECWMTLAAVAARTKTLKIGPLVSPIGFRNPAVLARMAWTLHSFSRGRLQLGIGAGWYKNEYDSNGIEFPSFKVRDEQLGEALRIIRPFTQGEKVDFHGKYFSAQMEGHPGQAGRIHLVIGGRARPIIRKAALYADEWNSYLHPPEYLEEAKVILNSAHREIQISHMGPFIIAESEANLRNKVRAEMRRAGISKDPELYTKELRGRGRIVETLDGFGDAVNLFRQKGVEKFYFQILNPSDRESIVLLADALKKL